MDPQASRAGGLGRPGGDAGPAAADGGAVPLSASTEKVYRTGRNSWSSWASGRGVAVIPARPRDLRGWLAARVAEGKTAATARTYLAAVAHWHRGLGGPNPADDPEVRRVVEEMERRAGAEGRTPGDEAAAVFAQHGAEQVYDETGGLIIPDSLIEMATRDATATSNIVTSSPLASNRIYSFMRPMSAMGSLGIAMTSTDGTPRHSWVNASPDGAAAAKDPTLTRLSVDAATMLEKELRPVRILAKRGITVEAGASLGALATVITDDANSAATAELESQVFNGNGTVPNLTGINSCAESARSAQATVDTFATVVTAVEVWSMAPMPGPSAGCGCWSAQGATPSWHRCGCLTTAPSRRLPTWAGWPAATWSAATHRATPDPTRSIGCSSAGATTPVPTRFRRGGCDCTGTSNRPRASASS